jgi:3-dehydrosphinganine reductase
MWHMLGTDPNLAENRDSLGCNMADIVSRPSTVRPFRAGCRVMITGGSSGIGFALARQLVERGAHVCIAARDPGRLETALTELRRLVRGPEQVVCSQSMDVTSPASVGAGIARILSTLGGLDVLINNAGYAMCGYVDEIEERAYEEMLAVNYLGPVRVIRALLPHFIAQRGGHIVNVTSMLGFMGTFGYGAYSASKFALSGFTECLRQDLLPLGVGVHLCYPPTTKTPGLERENLTKPKESWAIEGASKAFAAERVAASILRGIERRRFHIVVGFESWLIWFVQRLAPWLVRRVTDGILLRYIRTHGDGRNFRSPGTAEALPQKS